MEQIGSHREKKRGQIVRNQEGGRNRNSKEETVLISKGQIFSETAIDGQ